MTRRSHYRYQTLCALGLVLAAANLGGCHKLSPNDASNTIALLKAGSERVCVAADVQKDLKGLILPEPADLGGDVAQDDAQSAIDELSLSFDATTLQATDSSVNKASCTTNASVSALNGDTRRFHLSYEISPSAEDPNTVVITADTSDVSAFAKDQIANNIAHINQTHAQEQQAAQDAQAHQQLLAMITPKWLVGTWIPSDVGSAACANGAGFDFQPDHTVGERSLRWALAGDNLHIVGSANGRPVDQTMTITAADAVSFTYEDGEAGSFRRCTRDEMSAGQDMDSTEGLDAMTDNMTPE